MRVKPQWWDCMLWIMRSLFTRELSLGLLLSPLSFSDVRTQWEGGHLQARKETSPYFNTALWSQMFSLRNGGKINVCCLSHPVYGICYENSGRWRCRIIQILSEIRETCYSPILFIIRMITNLKGSIRKLKAIFKSYFEYKNVF